ncbi:MAG TPA: hypothetical protein PLS50_08905, partial [Candidatus Dojkabacteria bacterium]|nr:hypothetical protein [Candidatus Dojkabacteria bacterium]
EFANFWARIKGATKGVTALKVNNMRDGFGDVQQQNYRVSISNPAKSPGELYNKISSDINSIYGTDQGDFKFKVQQNSQQLTKNDYIEIDPNLKGFNMFVKVADVQVYNENNRKSGVDMPHQGFSTIFRTMQGHVEVGSITFTALEMINPQTGDITFEFNISSTSRINHGVGNLLNSTFETARNAQQEVWHQVLQNVSDYMGGTVKDANQVIRNFKYSEIEDVDNDDTQIGNPKNIALPAVESKNIKITGSKKK